MVDIAITLLKAELAIHEAKLAELDAARDATKEADENAQVALGEQQLRVNGLFKALKHLERVGFGPPPELELES